MFFAGFIGHVARNLEIHLSIVKAMKTLYLLRHAKAEAGGKEQNDTDRALSPVGREACVTMGAYLRKKHYIPDFVISSPSARTRETLEQVMKAAGSEWRQRYINKLYLATAGEILRSVQQADDNAASLMVIGHNPGMHHAALVLARPEHTPLRTALELKYPTCALAVLRFTCNHWREVAPGSGELVDFITPKTL
jgi:phosphohistidine phosphatase